MPYVTSAVTPFSYLTQKSRLAIIASLVKEKPDGSSGLKVRKA
jgi:hypothetical protein